jgi:hypothetical protein
VTPEVAGEDCSAEAEREEADELHAENDVVEVTVRWSNFECRDPNVGVFLKSTAALRTIF